LREISLLVGYEIPRALPVTSKSIETPLRAMKAPLPAGKKNGAGADFARRFRDQ